MTDNGQTNLIERQTIALEAIALALTRVAAGGKPVSEKLPQTTLERAISLGRRDEEDGV